MVQFFVLQDIVFLSCGTKNPSLSLMFTTVLVKVSMCQIKRLSCQSFVLQQQSMNFSLNFSKTSQKPLSGTILGTLEVEVQQLIFKSSRYQQTRKNHQIQGNISIFVKLSRSRLFLSCFTRICVFSSFLSKSKDPLLEKYHYRYGYITQQFN